MRLKKYLSKTRSMVLHQPQRNVTIPERKLENNSPTIEYLDKINFLGITVNNQLRWDSHIKFHIKFHVILVQFIKKSWLMHLFLCYCIIHCHAAAIVYYAGDRNQQILIYYRKKLFLLGLKHIENFM